MKKIFTQEIDDVLSGIVIRNTFLTYITQN